MTKLERRRRPRLLQGRFTQSNKILYSAVSTRGRIWHTCVSRYEELKAWLKQWVLRRQRNVCDEEQARMSAGSEFHTEGQQRWNHGKQRLCGQEEPTTDWCWRSVENGQGCDS